MLANLRKQRGRVFGINLITEIVDTINSEGKEEKDVPPRFRRNVKPLSIEQKIEKFILRNSDNGYFTKFSTISAKFGILEDRTWEIIGEILVDGKIESIHGHSGEMKLCKAGLTYQILNSEQKRKKTPRKKYSKSKSSFTKDKDILPSQCHPKIKPQEN